MSNFDIDTRVRLAKPLTYRGKFYAGEAQVGDLGTVTGPGFTDPDTTARVAFDDAQQDYSVVDLDCLEVVTDEAPARPVVQFSGDSKTAQTRRDYADAAWSKILPESAQATLNDARNGVDVDAYALNDALAHAMSAAATRHGQSMARRALTKKIRHLHYATQAVIEAHAKSLPALEPGARSPKIAALEEQVANLESQVDDYRSRLAAADRAWSGDKAEIDRLNAVARGAIQGRHEAEDRALALAREAEGAQAVLTRQVEGTQAVLEYALRLLSPENRAKVAGYVDGREDAESGR